MPVKYLFQVVAGLVMFALPFGLAKLLLILDAHT
jgi:hypothetical protein